MPLPRPEIIDLSRSYAHQLEVNGGDPIAAANYLRDKTHATPGQIRRAIYQAKKAIEVGETLARMGLQEHLREALEGKQAPARTVGVRVELLQWLTDPPQGEPWRVNTLYVEARWDETIEQVRERAKGWLEAKPGKGYNVKSIQINFVGPSLWPGGTAGLQLGV